MYWFNGQRWVKLTEDMNWVHGTGVNTTDQKMFGNDYAGYVWANVTHFSTYGLAGEVHTAPPTPTPTPTPLTSTSSGGPRDWDGDGWSDFREILEGTDPENPDTDGDGIWDANDPEPLVSSVATPTPAPSPSPSPTPVPTTPAVTPTPAPTASETTPEVETPQPEEPQPAISLELIAWIFLLLVALLVIGYGLLRRRR